MKRLFFTYVVLLLAWMASGQDTVKTYPIKLPPGEVMDVSISYDGTHLALLSATKDTFYIYEYQRNGSYQWSDPHVIFQSTTAIQGPSYGPDNNRIYMSMILGNNYDICYIDRKKDGWTNPVSLDSLINTDRDELSPFVDPMGRIIYFSRDEGDKEPCTHLFYSVMEQGKWSKAKKIVAPINLGCEGYPRLEIDGEKVYFISQRENDKSFDIYYTKKITQEIYTIPEKFGFSHVRRDEQSPAYDPQLNALVFIRQDREPGVFYVKLGSQFMPSPYIIVRGKIRDKETGKPLPAVVSVLNPVTNSPVSVFYTYTGDYQLILPPEQNFTIKVTGKGLSTAFYNWEGQKIESPRIDTIDFELFSKINLQLNVFDKLIYDRLRTNIAVYDSLKGTRLDTIKIEELEKGKYVIQLPIGNFYAFHLDKENYAPYSFSLDLRVPILYQNFEKDVDLNPRLQRVVLKVVDANSQRGVETEVEVVSKTTGARYKVKLKTDAQGNVVLFLKKGDVYELSITPRGYTFYSQELNLQEDTAAPQEIVAKVKPLKKDLKMQFHNITFELNSADLKEEAYPILDQLVKFLKQNPDIKVEISAHTDDLGSEQYNLKLSLRRANSVVEYLKEHGISPDRMIAIGYGESRPLVPNDSDEHRAMNRRVEFKILEIK